MEANLEKLQKICEPVVAYLKNYNPHTSIVITDSSIKVEQTQVFIPLNEEND